MKKISNWLETRKATAIFTITSLFGGILFINQSTLTGNAILNTTLPFNLLSLIGLLLIICSVILGAYSLKKK
ncbi:MAG: hypothetical protein ABIA78_00340 [archaeon]